LPSGFDCALGGPFIGLYSYGIRSIAHSLGGHFPILFPRHRFTVKLYVCSFSLSMFFMLPNLPKPQNNVIFFMKSY